MPWTMIAASIGAQLFNSWQANKKTEELQARQREFQRAAQQKDFDRIRQLQRETAQLALEIEADVHKQRLEDIEANYDDIVKQYSTEIAIKKWPLKVLPFVMRGESFGTFFNGTKSIALHVILTPSNCDRFNEAVYTDIDLQLEAACNQHWNTQSFHPIAYYGGAWRKSSLDLDHVDLLKTQLKNVPTIVITPYFAPKLYFKVQMWGMGKDTEVKIEPTNGVFSYEDDYVKGMDYAPKDESPKGDLIDTTIEVFVPYMESLIGFVADKYYWDFYGYAPLLPLLIKNNKNAISTTLKSIYSPQYKQIYTQELDGFSAKLYGNPQSILGLYNNIKSFIGDAIPFPTEAARLLYKKKLNITLWYCSSLKELSAKIKFNYFYLKKVSNNIALGTYDRTDNVTNLIIIMCDDMQLKPTAMIEINMLSNEIKNILVDKFSNIDIDVNMLKSEISRYNSLLEEASNIYVNLSAMIELDEFKSVNNRFKSSLEIKEWINKYRKEENTSFALIRAYSKDLCKYLLLGLFYVKDEAQMSQTALISYYDTLPQDIDAYYDKTNKYIFTLN